MIFQAINFHGEFPWEFPMFFFRHPGGSTRPSRPRHPWSGWSRDTWCRWAKYHWKRSMHLAAQLRGEKHPVAPVKLKWNKFLCGTSLENADENLAMSDTFQWCSKLLDPWFLSMPAMLDMSPEYTKWSWQIWQRFCLSKMKKKLPSGKLT